MAKGHKGTSSHQKYRYRPHNVISEGTEDGNCDALEDLRANLVLAVVKPHDYMKFRMATRLNLESISSPSSTT